MKNSQGIVEHAICVRCVMDTSDPAITFDSAGVCCYCRKWEHEERLTWHPNAEGERIWQGWVQQMKAEGKGKEYDCIIGISGGADSAYLAWKLRDSGLRMLAVHVDGGWNSEISVANIEMLCKSLQLDLFTYVVDWDEMRDLQLAFFRSGVANQDVPQDHAFFSQLYRQANRLRIRYFLSGGNLATECILPRAWGYNAMDRRHLRGIHRRFGTRPLRTFPTIGFLSLYVTNPFIRRFRVLRPLNWMKYIKKEAKLELSVGLGWKDYGDKHHESRFTKFFQSWYLPVKFGFDKRKAHLSSMINSEQITREEALAELSKAPFDATTLNEDKRFLAKKLGISLDEFGRILAQPVRTWQDYPSNAALFACKDRAMRWLRSRK